MLLPVGTRFGRQSFSENRDFFSSRFITLPSGEKKPFGASALFLSGGDFHHFIATFRAVMRHRWLAPVALCNSSFSSATASIALLLTTPKRPASEGSAETRAPNSLNWIPAPTGCDSH